MKKCSKCGEQKELNEYYNHPHNLDGIMGSCKTCCRSREHKRQIEIAKDDHLRSIRNSRQKQYRLWRKERISRAAILIN